MKYYNYFFFVLWSMLAISCGATGEDDDGDALPEIVTQIQAQGRLYSTEYQLHKIITQDDTKQLQGSVFNQKYNIDLPLGKRSIAIPIEATVKAYVDFSDFSESNVRRQGDGIEIILPDPQFELTSTRVSHDEVKQYIPLLRSNFSDRELTALAQAGRAAIERDLPKLNLTEPARQNMARVLIPMLRQMGFEEDQITVTFRKQFSPRELSNFLISVSN
ncbi:MAG: DUF4230 domain-containing protein [Prevotella sp.]|nr:DUF4230 domain-containing protein [Prevotella sp.]MBR3726221.1 DUF4230 domain-containing protein [Prevotella sp.]MBR7043974.1 DUF4230 domain-containing protein [Prevotella sp.]MBR7087257.1 DUF4230 domain-containing protein [Prevotella sp.]